MSALRAGPPGEACRGSRAPSPGGVGGELRGVPGTVFILALDALVVRVGDFLKKNATSMTVMASALAAGAVAFFIFPPT